jgi:hypothetical protein
MANKEPATVAAVCLSVWTRASLEEIRNGPQDQKVLDSPAATPPGKKPNAFRIPTPTVEGHVSNEAPIASSGPIMKNMLKRYPGIYISLKQHQWASRTHGCCVKRLNAAREKFDEVRGEEVVSMALMQ